MKNKIKNHNKIIAIIIVIICFGLTLYYVSQNIAQPTNEFTLNTLYNLSDYVVYEINVSENLNSNNHIFEPDTLEIAHINDLKLDLNKYYYVDIVGTNSSNEMRSSVEFYTYQDNKRTNFFSLGINSVYNVIKLDESYDKIKVLLSYYGKGKIKINKIIIYEVTKFNDKFVESKIHNINNKINFELLTGVMNFNVPLLNDETSAILIENLNEKKYYISKDYSEVDFNNGYVWDDSINDNRSYLLSLHGFRSFSTYAELFNRYNDPTILKNYYYFIEDWIDNNKYLSQEKYLAYNDMAVALRVYNWLYFYDLSKEYLTMNEKNKIINSLYYQMNLLKEDHFYSRGTNHGLYQDVSYLFFNNYFSELSNPQKEKITFKDIEKYFNIIISSDGVHLEHSPSYHIMMAELLKKILPVFETLGLNTSKLKKVYDNMGEFATHIVKPDGTLPQIGDTDRTKLSKDYWDNDEYKYATSSCKNGKIPLKENVVYSESGHAIFRDDWSKCNNATYILFYNQYSSYYHKHSDELGLWIYRDGDIIREAGKGGYQYADPFVKYAYSSWGHNTLIVNNTGLVEHKNIPNDYNYLGTYIDDYSIDNPNDVWVSGINDRYEDVFHKRTVRYEKVINLITVNDNIESNQKNDYTILWHLSSDIKSLIKDNKIMLYRDNINIMDISFFTDTKYTINIVNGHINPRILGWHFNKDLSPEANDTITVNFTDVKNVSISTIFEFKY